jgi:hypothetical protein
MWFFLPYHAATYKPTWSHNPKDYTLNNNINIPIKLKKESISTMTLKDFIILCQYIPPMLTMGFLPKHEVIGE